MGDGKLNIKVNYKVIDQSRLKHCVRIRNLTKEALKMNGNRYDISLKFGNRSQIVEINLSFLKNVIDNRENLKRDIVNIKFKEDNIDIEIERIYSINKIEEYNNMYSISYESTQFQMRANVNNQLSKEYFESKFLPKVNKKKGISRKDRQIVHKKKDVKQHSGKLSPEELRRVDFYYSDLYAYKYSPNSDGNRSKREEFGGSGSNMRRRGRRI